MVKSYEEQLINHIEALEKGYDNIILLLNDDLDTNEQNELTLKDDKKKTFAEGVAKLSQTADELIERIKIKKVELDKLQNPNNLTLEEVKEKKGEHDMNKHLS